MDIFGSRTLAQTKMPTMLALPLVSLGCPALLALVIGYWSRAVELFASMSCLNALPCIVALFVMGEQVRGYWPSKAMIAERANIILFEKSCGHRNLAWW